MTTTQPRIYIASLADYNAGRLVGQWVEIGPDTDVTDLVAAADAVLAESREPGAEEYAVHDQDGFPSGALGEYDPLDYYAAVGAFLAAEPWQAEERLAFLSDVRSDLVGPDAQEIETAFCDAYSGTFDSAEDYARYLVEECGDLDSIPEHLRPYFDYAAFARDLSVDYAFVRLGGDSVGQVAVFSTVV